MSNRKIVPVAVTGNDTYVSGGRARVPLDEIQEIASSAGMVTYLRGLRLRLDVTLANGSGAPIVIGNTRILDLLQDINLDVPGHPPLVDLHEGAGSKLYALKWAMEGMKPPVPAPAAGAGALSVPAGGSLVVRATLEIPFRLPGGVEEDDSNIPLVSLRKGAELQLVWCPTANFGADITVSAATRVTVLADLIERSEFRAPVWTTIGNIEQNGRDAKIPLAGRVVHAIIEVQEPTAGQIADGAVTDAERDECNLTYDGRMLLERVDARDLVTFWSDVYAVSVADRLPDHELNTSPFVPLHLPWRSRTRGGYKVTQLPLAKEEPQLRVTGTDTTPQLVYLTSYLNNSRAIVQQVQTAEIPVPRGLSPDNLGQFFRPKTFSKDDAASGARTASRLPAKLYPQGVAAG